MEKLMLNTIRWFLANYWDYDRKHSFKSAMLFLVTFFGDEARAFGAEWQGWELPVALLRTAAGTMLFARYLYEPHWHTWPILAWAIALIGPVFVIVIVATIYWSQVLANGLEEIPELWRQSKEDAQAEQARLTVIRAKTAKN